MANLNSMEKLKKDNHKTSYVKYKVHKLETYGLAFVDTGNLVTSTLVSKEFWEAIGGKCQEQATLG